MDSRTYTITIILLVAGLAAWTVDAKPRQINLAAHKLLGRPSPNPEARRNIAAMATVFSQAKGGGSDASGASVVHQEGDGTTLLVSTGHAQLRPGDLVVLGQGQGRELRATEVRGVVSTSKSPDYTLL